MRREKWGAAALAAVLLGVSGCGGTGQADRIRPELTVYLHDSSLLEAYAPRLQELVPEAELTFIVGRDSVDFYLFRQEHGELPDIITLGGGLAVRESLELDPYLMDLSETETAASFYDTYLESCRGGDGRVYWLPAGGIANGIIANVDLFDEYGIPLPRDYSGFAAACEAFSALGIQPYTTDYKYDYTCLHTLEGWSIPALMSRQGMEWRRDYERGRTDSLDEALWMEAFGRFDRFAKDAGLGPAEVGRGYTMTLQDFQAGKVPMIRGMASELTGYLEYHNCVLLPYFGETEGDGWLLTAPRFYAALNGALEGRRRELALQVLDAIFPRGI